VGAPIQTGGSAASARPRACGKGAFYVSIRVSSARTSAGGGGRAHVVTGDRTIITSWCTQTSHRIGIADSSRPLRGGRGDDREQLAASGAERLGQRLPMGRGRPRGGYSPLTEAAQRVVGRTARRNQSEGGHGEAGGGMPQPRADTLQTMGASIVAGTGGNRPLLATRHAQPARTCSSNLYAPILPHLGHGQTRNWPHVK
jgi:hypothetical protein